MNVLKAISMLPIKCLELILSPFYKFIYLGIVKYVLALLIAASLLGLIALAGLYAYDYYNASLAETSYYLNHLFMLLGVYFVSGLCQIGFSKLLVQKELLAVLNQQVEHAKVIEIFKEYMKDKDLKAGYSLPELTEEERLKIATELRSKNDSSLLEELRRHYVLYKEIVTADGKNEVVKRTKIQKELAEELKEKESTQESKETKKED